MKKSVLFIVLVFLTSCQTAPILESTAISAPTNTFLPSTATSTSVPTSSPIPLTATTESYQDYIQASENTFPLKETEGLFDFVCTADFDNVIHKSHTTPDGTVTRLWVPCEDGGVTFVTELFLHNNDSRFRYWTMSNAASQSTTNVPPSESYVTTQNENALKILKASGKTKVRIIGGSNSDALLRINNPMPSIYGSVNWDELFLEFAKTGNYTMLPKINGLPEHLLYAIRIEVVK